MPRRCGLTVAVVERMGVGGQIAAAERIENFPGFPQGLSGAELGPLLHEQAEAAGAEFVLDTVEGIAIDGDWRVVNCASETLKARAVIVAAGSALRSLGVPGEEAFLGRGVSHCASCDGHFFSGQEVCVIGGGDSALDEALVLTEHAARVTIIHRGRDVRRATRADRSRRRQRQDRDRAVDRGRGDLRRRQRVGRAAARPHIADGARPRGQRRVRLCRA